MKNKEKNVLSPFLGKNVGITGILGNFKDYLNYLKNALRTPKRTKYLGGEETLQRPVNLYLCINSSEAVEADASSTCSPQGRGPLAALVIIKFNLSINLGQ